MILVGLDVGTTKVTAVIGELSKDGILDVIGEGTVPAQGMRRGVVTNLERTTDAIRQAVSEAERMCGVKVDSVWVGVAGTNVKSVTSHGLAAIRRGQQINSVDIERAIEQAKAYNFEGDYELIHAMPIDFSVDGQEDIPDPVGMAGVRLEVDVHLVAVSKGPLANLRKAVNDAGLDIAGLVLQSYASGLAVLLPEENAMTTMLIDIGGGTTDVAVFQQGRLAHSAVVPVGGDHVCQDISKILHIPVEQAERTAKKYGAALPELADPELTLELNSSSCTAADLARIIRPRLQEILHLSRNSVDEALGTVEIMVGRVVITGGSGLIKGIDDLAKKQYGLPVRIGKPIGIQGLVDVVSSPTHAVAVGLVRHGATVSLPQTASRGPLLRIPKPSILSKSNKSDNSTPSTNETWEKIRGIFKNFF